MSSSQTGAADAPTVLFSVQAVSDPGVMPRLMELFAKRGLVPTRWSSHATEGGRLAVEIQMAGMDRALGDYVGRCMRQVSGVETVLTAQLRASPSPAEPAMMAAG